MSDNTAWVILICVALLCMTSCNISQDWLAAHKCVESEGQK